jgi:hypothetical protein
VLWLCVVALAAVPLMSAGIWAVGWIKGTWIDVYGTNLVGSTRLGYRIGEGAVHVDYLIGWKGTPPSEQGSRPFPGLRISRNVVTLNVPDPQGDVIYGIHFHWGLLAATNALFLVPASVLVLHIRRRCRRLQEGLCRVCGYDLRASPQRCPECGTAVPAATPSAKAT